MNLDLVKKWADKHGPYTSEVPEDMRQDTLCLAVYLIGPLTVAASFGLLPTRDMATIAWSETLNPELRELVDSLAHLGLTARLPAWPADEPIAALVPRNCPIFLPRDESGVQMMRAAARIAHAEIAHLWTPPDHETEAPPGDDPGGTSRDPQGASDSGAAGSTQTSNADATHQQ